MTLFRSYGQFIPFDISRLNRTKQERQSIFPVTPPNVNKRGSVNLKT